MGSPQKVVIPKGLINPKETTIVEIPANLQNVATVVARPRPKAYQPSPGNTSGESTPKLVKKRSYTRRTYPPKSRAKGDILHNEGFSFGGRDFDPDATPPPQPWYPKSPRDRYGDISPSDVSYAVGKHIPLDERQGFDPAYHTCSTPLGLDDPVDRSMYRDFRPKQASSRAGSPPRAPGSVKKFHSSIGTVSPDTTPESYFFSSVTTSSPEGVEVEDTEEQSYYEYGDPATDISSPATGDESCPCSDGSSGAYQRFDLSSDSSPPSGMPSPIVPRVMTEREVMNSLGELEGNELNQIMGDLHDFQLARRRLVFDASSLASAADISSSLLSSSG